MKAKADIRRVQEWMGHADIQTTMRYLHYAPHAEDARLVAEAFSLEGARGELVRTGVKPTLTGGCRPDVPRRPNSAQDVLQDVPRRG